MAILVWRDRNAVGATALGRTDRGTTLKPGSKTTLSTALTAMSDYRKDFLGQTIIDNIREYDPRLGRKEAELG